MPVLHLPPKRDIVMRSDPPCPFTATPLTLSIPAIIAIGVLGLIALIVSPFTIHLWLQRRGVRNRIYAETTRATLSPEPFVEIIPRSLNVTPTPFTPADATVSTTDVISSIHENGSLTRDLPSFGRAAVGMSRPLPPLPNVPSTSHRHERSDQAHDTNPQLKKFSPTSSPNSSGEPTDDRLVSNIPPVLPPVRRPSPPLRRFPNRILTLDTPTLPERARSIGRRIGRALKIQRSSDRALV
ncbi:hypothetical protein CALCODRAFT_503591 [Calocera cornea HHB12733]|uniref:Uncharacterized protein n=1 Tax=Calocera cornea HHB12733 TaxID=1353952 RepID=A0A165CTT5_9BASI|nr:hypothetical protein CALCODRAFT_503591 [Calocera cornea HHB12733]